MAARVNGIVVGGVSGGGAAGQIRGGRSEPKGIDGAVGRRGKNVVVHGYVGDGVLKKDVTRDVNAEVAVEGIVVNGASGELAAALAPDMDAIMVIGIRRGIPVGEVVEMIVANAVVAHGSGNSRSEAVIDVVNIGVFQGEIVSVTGDGPRSVVAGDVINREVVGIQPVNTIDAVGRGKIRR